MSLRYLTAGESHGKGLTAILEGMPSQVPIPAESINFELARRQQGYGRGGRMKIEKDQVEITGGIRFGKTLGSPIALWIENKDWRSWQKEMAIEATDFESKKMVECPRPGHADLNGGRKYDHHDLRNVLERASARETTARVAVGAICRTFLEQFKINIVGHVTCIGGVALKEGKSPSPEEIKKLSDASDVGCMDGKISAKMREVIDRAKSKGDTVGGIFEILVSGHPPGLGSHVQWDRKLDGLLAQAILSIQAIKGVEFGIGFKAGQVFGSEAHDEIYYKESQFIHATNRAGGIEGGMTNGEPILIRAVMKPISTLYQPLHSVNIRTKEEVTASVERSDTCAVPAARVIAENVVAFEVARAFLEKFGGDSLPEIKRNYDGYLQQIRDY